MTTSEAALAGRLTGVGHELLQRVYFEDTDFTGRVYHARYLQFLERGRSDYLRLLGVHHRELAREGRAFVVSRMAIDFRKPARIDDIVTVATEPAACSGARLVLNQAALRGAETLVEAEVTVALIGPQGRPERLPESLKAAFGLTEEKHRRSQEALEHSPPSCGEGLGEE